MSPTRGASRRTSSSPISIPLTPEAPLSNASLSRNHSAAQMEYDHGILRGGDWKQWSDSIGQDFYEDLTTGTIQYHIPMGYEDHDSDTWAVDSSTTWPQWRNERSGRIKRINPNPQTYLDSAFLQVALKAVERAPEPLEYLYRRVIVEALEFFFSHTDRFHVFLEPSHGGSGPTVLKVLQRIASTAGDLHFYDYCMVESRKAGASWAAAEDQLSWHCGGTVNDSKKLYCIVHIGLHVQFFKANRGVLVQLSNRLHLRNEVNEVTHWFENMKRYPLGFAAL